MSRRDSNKKLNGKDRIKQQDKLIEKLLIEFGIKEPPKYYNKKHNKYQKGAEK